MTKITENFEQLDIDPRILTSLAEMGIVTPTPVQAQTLPILLGESTDFMGLAATGTGKTAAFAIPLIQKVNPKSKVVQALILCPTRELAIQVTEQINILGKHMKVKAIAVYGGASYGDQIYGLKSGAAIVVGTPGRVIDHLDRGTLKISEIETIVLDEADEMISMGFKDDLELIFEKTDEDKRNIWLFSATMGSGVRDVADSYLNDPQQVHTNKTDIVPTNVEQIYYYTQESLKPDLVCKIVDSTENFYGVVFCQTKSLVSELTDYLVSQGHKVDSLHGDKDQKSRERTMKAFKSRAINLLVCTDVASRGIDVKDITHVINYSLPKELDIYVHRIGRTARSGKAGVAINLVTPSHRGLIRRIEQFTKSQMNEARPPSGKEIAAKKIDSYLELLLQKPVNDNVLKILNEKYKDSITNVNPFELAARFLAMALPEVVNLKEVVIDKKFEDNFERNRRSPQGETRRPRFRSGGDRDDRNTRPRTQERGRYSRDESRGPSEKRFSDNRQERSSGDSRSFKKNDRSSR